MTNPHISPTPAMVEAAFQERVDKWVLACFPRLARDDKLERADRFIEEALETVQAAGYCCERAHALVDYVFEREAGKLSQEVGGTMTTLAALCNAHDVDMDAAAETELARVWTKIEKIRAKQAAKPVGSALPIPSALRSSIPVELAVRAAKAAVPLPEFPLEDGHRAAFNYGRDCAADAVRQALARRAEHVPVEEMRRALGEAFSTLIYIHETTDDASTSAAALEAYRKIETVLNTQSGERG